MLEMKDSVQISLVEGLDDLMDDTEDMGSEFKDKEENLVHSVKDNSTLKIKCMNRICTICGMPLKDQTQA